MEHIETDIIQEEFEDLSRKYLTSLREMDAKFKESEIKNEMFYTKSELVQKTQDQHESLLRELDLNDIFNDQFEFSDAQAENLLEIFDSYIGMKTRDRNASKLILKTLHHSVQNQMRVKELGNEAGQLNQLNQLGLDKIQYMTLKSLPESDPVLLKMFMKGEITQEQFSSK